MGTGTQHAGLFHHCRCRMEFVFEGAFRVQHPSARQLWQCPTVPGRSRVGVQRGVASVCGCESVCLYVSVCV